MPYIADIWNVVKCDEEECEEFYIVIFNVQDAQNLTILKPRSGQLSLSTKLFRLDSFVDIIPAYILTIMVEIFFKKYGHIGHKQQSGKTKPCSINDLINLKLAINIFQVD